MHIDIGYQAYVREVCLLLENLKLSYQWEELSVCKDDWDYAASLTDGIHEQDTARKVKSIMDRMRQMLGEVNDIYAE
jgi:hypothetical protein